MVVVIQFVGEEVKDLLACDYLALFGDVVLGEVLEEGLEFVVLVQIHIILTLKKLFRAL